MQLWRPLLQIEQGTAETWQRDEAKDCMCARSGDFVIKGVLSVSSL